MCAELLHLSLKACIRGADLFSRTKSELHTCLIIEPVKGDRKSVGDSPHLSKLMNFIILGSFWLGEALVNMLTSIVSNSHFGKRPGARDMTIFGFMLATIIFIGNYQLMLKDETF